MISNCPAHRGSAERRAAAYMMAGHMGAAGTALFFAGQAFSLPDFIQGFAIGIMLASLTVLLLRKLRDEYVQQLWNRGVSWAFVAVVVLFLAAPFVAKITGQESATAFDVLLGGWIAPIAIAAFFAGFYWEWLRDLG